MTIPTSPRLPIPGGYQMTLKIDDGGQPAAIVLGAVATADGDGVSNADLLAWRDTAWAAFRPLMLTTTAAQSAVFRETATGDTTLEAGAPPNPGGAGTGPQTVAAACTLIKWSTAKGGRSGKGRTYLPGLGASLVIGSGRTYHANLAGFVTTAVTAYLGGAPFVSGGMKPAVLSFKRGEAYQITGGALAATVGLQRRRMRA